MQKLLLAACVAAVSPAWGQAVTSSSANPAISLILEGLYSDFSSSPEAYSLPGFQLGGEAGLGEEGLALGHNELSISGNIDDQFYGSLTAAIAQHEGETEVELEEAYMQTLGLGGGLGLKAGRFFSGLGYLNSHHRHAWDFIDAPLVYAGLFGNQLSDDGLQLSWVAPTDLYILFGAEALRGERFPAAGAANGGKGAGTLFFKLGGDVGSSHSWQLGFSHWRAEMEGRQGGGHDHGGEAVETATFTGDSRVSGVDLVWKWAPDGNSTQRNFKLQAEYYQRDEEGDVEMLGALTPEVTSYDGTQRGWYAQAVYQFMPRWRVGLRHDWLESDNRGTDTILLDEAGLLSDHEPQRSSVMVDFSNSEYSRIRLQYNRDESSPDTEDQIYLQYMMSLGAHGAHRF